MKPIIVNLSPKLATVEQLRAGVYNLPLYEHTKLLKLYEFQRVPDSVVLAHRANKVAELATTIDGDWSEIQPSHALIGCPDFMQWHLIEALKVWHVRPAFWFQGEVVLL